jgi:nitrate reductase molybdenum cofactor assembly chaperone
MKDTSHYALLAEMFRYPSDRMNSFTRKWRALTEKYDQGLLPDLEPFLKHIREKTLTSRQEYFVTTFDVQPVCCLDTGYILFGEDYRRGQFMANLKAEHRKAGTECGTELPDHLPNVLVLLSKMKDKDLAEELTCSLLIPAVEKMISGFRNRKNHYRGLLNIVCKIMQADYPEKRYDAYVIRQSPENCEECNRKSVEI